MLNPRASFSYTFSTLPGRTRQMPVQWKILPGSGVRWPPSAACRFPGPPISSRVHVPRPPASRAISSRHYGRAPYNSAVNAVINARLALRLALEQCFGRLKETFPGRLRFVDSYFVKQEKSSRKTASTWASKPKAPMFVEGSRWPGGSQRDGRHGTTKQWSVGAERLLDEDARAGGGHRRCAPSSPCFNGDQNQLGSGIGIAVTLPTTARRRWEWIVPMPTLPSLLESIA